MKIKTTKILNIIILIGLVLILLSITVSLTESKYVVAASVDQIATVSLGTYGFKYSVESNICYITGFVAQYSYNNLVEYAPDDISLGSLKYDYYNNLVLTFPTSYTVDGVTYTNMVVRGDTTYSTNGFPIYNIDGTLLVDKNKNNVMIDKIVLPDNIVKLGYRAFYRYTYLSEVVFGDSLYTSNLSYIDKGAFENCTSLYDVALPANLTTIGINAFKNCTYLRYIYLPESVTTISASTYGNSPFYGCSFYMRIYCGAYRKPSGWGRYWNYYANKKVLNCYYGYTYEDYLY